MNKQVKSLLSWVLYSVLIVFTSVIVSISILSPQKFVKVSITDCTKDYQMEKELNYWVVKSQLVDAVQDYINTVAPSSALSSIVVVNACEEYQIDIAFALAQGHIESHFGTKGLASRTNSVWNVGAFDGYSVEKIDGRYKYKHPDNSVRPYLALITSKYVINGKCEQDMFDSYTTPEGQRYATYTYYEKELKSKYDAIMESELGRLIDQFRLVKLTMNR